MRCPAETSPDKVGPTLADRFQRVTDMNRTSALRNARAALTQAQNAGRQESMLRAKEMGIYQRKQWIAAKDMRTRHSHGMLDGQAVEVDECFVTENGSKMMFPGDSANGAEPCDVYNCRCAMRTVEKEGIEAEPRQMRVRNPITGKNELVSEMTYPEWVEWKNSLENDMENVIIESLGNNRPRNRSLEKAIRRSITSEKPIFCEGRLWANSRNIKAIDGFYDAILHGTSKTGELFGEKISPQILANVLRARTDYAGQSIRLFSCSTGRYDADGNCFAQELSDILGVIVQAPDDKLWVYPSGEFTIGRNARSKDGRMVFFTPKGGAEHEA